MIGYNTQNNSVTSHLAFSCIYYVWCSCCFCFCLYLILLKPNDACGRKPTRCCLINPRSETKISGSMCRHAAFGIRRDQTRVGREWSRSFFVQLSGPQGNPLSKIFHWNFHGWSILTYYRVNFTEQYESSKRPCHRLPAMCAHTLTSRPTETEQQRLGRRVPRHNLFWHVRAQLRAAERWTQTRSSSEV